MAIADGFIGTNNGMGQGLAYVLPQSKSEDYALKMAQDESRQLAATAAANLKRQQLLQDNIGKQFAAQKLPALWSPYNAAVSDAAKQWQTKAATFNANAGQSPFTNPELMNEYNTNVLGLAQKSKELGDRYTKLYSTAVADGGNKYTPESVKNVLDFEETVKKDPMAALNMPLPELKPASATFDDFNKLIKPIGITRDNGTLSTTQADRGNHITQGLETVTSNPEKWNPMTEKQFGLNLYLPTFPIKNARGRNIYPTNEKALDKFADNIMSQKDSPERLADFGISEDDEFAKEKLVDAMRKQNAGMGKFLTSVADLADAKVAKKSNYDNWREKMSLSDSYIKGRQKSSGSGSKIDDDVYYTNQFMDKVFAGARGDASGAGSGEQLGGILDGKGYAKEWSLPNSDKIQNKPYHVERFTTDGKPNGKIKITIAPKVLASGEEGEPQSITIDANNENIDRSKLNSFLKEATGGSLGVKESQIRTNQASGKVKQAQPTKTVPVSKIKSLVGKAGYEGYTEKELMDYYKSQGYTIK